MPKSNGQSRVSGFTLVELLVSTGLAGFIFTGIISTFLFLGRTSVGLAQYSDMEHQARRTFQVFGADCRAASDARWTNANTLILTVNAATITYQFSSVNKTFARSTTSGSETLAKGISTFFFKAFNIDAAELNLAANPSAVGAATKMIQVDMELSAAAATTVTSTQRLITTRFVLRNKKVS